MKNNGVEVSREIRLWITTIGFPVIAVGALIFKNPKVQKKYNDWKERKEKKKS